MSQAPCSRSVVMACLLSPIRSAAMWRVSSARQDGESGHLHGNHLAVDLHLRRTARAKRSGR